MTCSHKEDLGKIERGRPTVLRQAGDNLSGKSGDCWTPPFFWFFKFLEAQGGEAAESVRIASFRNSRGVQQFSDMLEKTSHEGVPLKIEVSREDFVPN